MSTCTLKDAGKKVKKGEQSCQGKISRKFLVRSGNFMIGEWSDFERTRKVGNSKIYGNDSLQKTCLFCSRRKDLSLGKVIHAKK